MGRPYETFGHTADLGLRATGSTREELYENAARGLMAVLCDLRTVRPRQRRAFEASSPGDETDLFVAFLAEALYHASVEQMIFRSFEVSFASAHRVSAKAWGEPITERHPVNREVKAVTHHQASVTRLRGRYRGAVILDI